MEMRLSPLLDDPGARKIFAALAGFETRFIGGCVRDALLGHEINDIDLATTALPSDTMRLLIENGISVIPTGIDHGTVTAVINHVPYEITTLRRDVATDGRRAVIAFSTDWREDALRRDFTINALSADAEGRLYDYTEGQRDLTARQLRFIGDAEQRIREDMLRILRFFRFASVLDWPIADGLAACTALAGGLRDLSRERIQSELYKLLLGDGVLRVVETMIETGVLQALIENPDFDRFEKSLSQPEAFRRLLALAGWRQDPGFIVLSRDQKKRLQALRKLENSDWDLKKILYFFGQETAWDYLLLIKQGGDYAAIDTWIKPVFPLKAEDVFFLTNGPGIAVGEKLKQAENHWVDRDFKPGKQDLLDFLPSI